MSEFVDYLHEVFMDFGAIRHRKMFGVHGIYHNDLMFGIIADDQLYLKVDKQSVSLFENLGLEPFKYIANNKESTMSYYLAPEEIYDDSVQASYWAEIAFQAALRASDAKDLKRSTREI